MYEFPLNLYVETENDSLYTYCTYIQTVLHTYIHSYIHVYTIMHVTTCTFVYTCMYYVCLYVCMYNIYRGNHFLFPKMAFSVSVFI